MMHLIGIWPLVPGSSPLLLPRTTHDRLQQHLAVPRDRHGSLQLPPEKTRWLVIIDKLPAFLNVYERLLVGVWQSKIPLRLVRLIKGLGADHTRWRVWRTTVALRKFRT
jgi:hypothetical protein